MTTIKATVRDRRIEVPAPADMPDGTDVTLTVKQTENGDTMSSEEIARILAAMLKLKPLDIPADVAADLDAWERRIDRHGVEYRDPSAEGVVP
jgi:hypothetical protein